MSFGEQLQNAFLRHGNLCFGIDLHDAILERHGFSVSADSAEELTAALLEASLGAVGIIKFQVAFYERFGARGYQILERALAEARQAGVLVIADIKRSEIGSSMRGYAHAWLGEGAPLRADAITVTPYLGVGALEPVFERAEASGAGVFVLAATSNPEGAALQQKGDPTLAATVVSDVNARGKGKSSVIAPFGIVLGATVVAADYGIDSDSLGAMPVLAPGFGEQGAALADLRKLYGSAAPRTVVNLSRSLLKVPLAELPGAIAAAQTELKAVLDD